MFVCALRHTLCSILTLFALHCSLCLLLALARCVRVSRSRRLRLTQHGWLGFRWLRQRHSCAPTVTHTHLCKYVRYVSIRFRWLFDLWCCVFGLLSHRSTDAFFSFMIHTRLIFDFCFFFSTGFFLFACIWIFFFVLAYFDFSESVDSPCCALPANALNMQQDLISW